jgi:hypothetical protein
MRLLVLIWDFDSSPTAVALLDSRLNEIHLPLLHLPPRPAYEEDDDDEDPRSQGPDIENVDIARVLGQFFDWAGVVNNGAST